MKIEVVCKECGKVRLYYACHAKKLKTDLCHNCTLVRRNRSPKMREVSRRNGKRPKVEKTRRKLSKAQKKHWTDERREQRSGVNNPRWRDGRTITSGGYIYVRCPGHPRATLKGSYVFEHILVMEQHLGRHLKDNEIVHHINKNKKDNRLENLIIMSPSEHARLHCSTRMAK